MIETKAVFMLDGKEVELQGIQEACASMEAVKDASGMESDKKEEIRLTIQSDSPGEPEIKKTKQSGCVSVALLRTIDLRRS